MAITRRTIKKAIVSEIKKDFTKYNKKFSRELSLYDHTKAVVVGFVLVVLAVAIGSIFLGVQIKNLAIRSSFYSAAQENRNWVAIKLTNGERVYGKVTSFKSDPIVLNPVYFNYDQGTADQIGQNIDNAGDLRLIKRGQENYGPDGSIMLFRSQIAYMERLRLDSKALKAMKYNQ
ncbi:MAG: hypothetical protein WCG01_05090 [bacterium]